MTTEWFKSFDGSLMFPLLNGWTIRVGLTGVMLLDQDKHFVCYLDTKDTDYIRGEIADHTVPTTPDRS